MPQLVLQSKVGSRTNVCKLGQRQHLFAVEGAVSRQSSSISMVCFTYKHQQSQKYSVIKCSKLKSAEQL